MAEVRWTFEALRCLEEIHAHLSSESPASVDKVVGGIYAKIQLLRDHSRLGQRFEFIIDREVREILYGHYRIAYLVVAEEHVEILGIFHGSMEIDRFLR